MGQFGLSDWTDVNALREWPALLAGNGASRAVSSRFSYDSLFVEATLDVVDRELFDHLATVNFEAVLHGLAMSRFVAEQQGFDVSALDSRYESVRHRLVETVNNHHVSWTAVDGLPLAAIRDALSQYSTVFTTSYDLLWYWAINRGGDGDGFIDHFWHDGHSFDADDSPLWGANTAVYWLHGALQIHRTGAASTAKRVNNGAALLTQFADDGLLPLYVAEGSADQKRQAIRESDYLTFCLDALRGEARDLVVFGQALGESDQHLVDAITLNAGRAVAYGVFPTTQGGVDEVRIRASNLLDGQEVHFFDTTTHPLGDAALTVD